MGDDKNNFAKRILYNSELRVLVGEVIRLSDSTTVAELDRRLSYIDDDGIVNYIRNIVQESTEKEDSKKINCKTTVPVYIKNNIDYFNSFTRQDTIEYEMLDTSYYRTIDTKSLNRLNLIKVFKNINNKTGVNRITSRHRLELIKQGIIDFIYKLANIIKIRLILLDGDINIEFMEIAFHILFCGRDVVNQLFRLQVPCKFQDNVVIQPMYLKPKTLFDDLYHF